MNWGVGKADENILIKCLIHTSREKDGKTFDGLAIIFFTKPQKFLEICLSYCMDEQGELIEDLFESLVLSRRDTYLISDVGAVSILSRFSAFFNAFVEYSLYLITSSLSM